MELPSVYFRVKLQKKISRYESPSPLTGLQGSPERSTKIYHLKGNYPQEVFQNYKDRMLEFSNRFSKSRIMRKVKEEIKYRHLIRQVITSPNQASKLRIYKLSYSPETLSKN